MCVYIGNKSSSIHELRPEISIRRDLRQRHKVWQADRDNGDENTQRQGKRRAREEGQGWTEGTRGRQERCKLPWLTVFTNHVRLPHVLSVGMRVHIGERDTIDAACGYLQTATRGIILIVRDLRSRENTHPIMQNHRTPLGRWQIAIDKQAFPFAFPRHVIDGRVSVMALSINRNRDSIIY